ncbi:MAG: cytochrome c biogenesis protein ResB [Candidatus Aminicenantes bacterium]|nr:cytochrome c biogenesis protein ResB [Candidatus Aminicenantes bacterium]
MNLRFLGSLKFAVFLIIGLAALCVLGTLLPGAPSGEFASERAQPAGILSFLIPEDLYHSPHFLILLSLFSLNIIVCTLTRLKPKVRQALRPSLEADTEALLAAPVSAQMGLKPELRASAEAVGDALRRRRYRIRRAEAPGRLVLLGRKRTAGRFGSDVVHLGLLVIVAGGIVSGLAGYRTILAIEEGATEPVPRTGFSLRLDKFDIEVYPDGSVKDWKSRLAVLEDGCPVLGKTIEVNHPLSYKGFLFYQSGYAPVREKPTLGLSVTGIAGDGFKRNVSVRPGSPVPLGENGLSLSVVRFVPDFALNARREVFSRSEEPRNPAALVEILENGRTVHRGWVFARHPEYGSLHGRADSKYALAFLSLKYDLVSLVEAARDPGPPLIWIGCGLVMAGLFLAFYWPPRETRVLFETVSGRTRLTAAASGRKNRAAIAEEFRNMVGEWKGLR